MMQNEDFLLKRKISKEHGPITKEIEVSNKCIIPPSKIVKWKKVAINFFPIRLGNILKYGNSQGWKNVGDRYSQTLWVRIPRRHFFGGHLGNMQYT